MNRERNWSQRFAIWVGPIGVGGERDAVPPIQGEWRFCDFAMGIVRRRRRENSQHLHPPAAVG